MLFLLSPSLHAITLNLRPAVGMPDNHDMDCVHFCAHAPSKKGKIWLQSIAMSLIVYVLNSFLYSLLQQFTAVGGKAVSVAVNQRIIGCR
jgi:hypothetical protein